MKATDSVPQQHAALVDHPSLKAAVQAAALNMGFSVAALSRAYSRHCDSVGHRHGNALITSEKDKVLLGGI